MFKLKLIVNSESNFINKENDSFLKALAKEILESFLFCKYLGYFTLPVPLHKPQWVQLNGKTLQVLKKSLALAPLWHPKMCHLYVCGLGTRHARFKREWATTGKASYAPKNIARLHPSCLFANRIPSIGKCVHFATLAIFGSILPCLAIFSIYHILIV